MVLPKTPKQCAIKIKSLKKQVTAMEQRKKKLMTAAKKKPAKKRTAKKRLAKKRGSKKKRRR